MSSTSISMGSGLFAVALAIRSRDGPRFVFHYPAHPSAGASQEDLLYGTDLDPTKMEMYSGDSDESDFDDAILGPFDRIHLSQKNDDDSDANMHIDCGEMGVDEHYDTSSGIHIVPWEFLFGFSTTDLESILTPSKAFRKSRFEITLDPLCFVSYPIHIREDGTWSKRRSRKKKKDDKSVTSVAAREDGNDYIKGHENEGKCEDHDEGGMTMFNAIFILDVPKYDLKQKVEEICEHVVKKFNWALMEAQASSGYVWHESEMILAMKEKAREDRRPMSWLWREILLKSTMASAIREIYYSISRNKIATLQLGPHLDFSLQIPVPSFLTSLPTSRDRGVPGLLTTSAIPLTNKDGDFGLPELNKHCALLLLENESRIISELQADNNEFSTALVECIRLCKPTQSFAQIAQTNCIELSSLLLLASHLIVYRRAIAIPPLHSRNVYIVSPNCDNRKLPKAGLLWKRLFPFAPSLLSFLAALSASPRPFKTLAPSRDHRPSYLEMLAWLMRGGWVTQLRTFCWIQVWPEIQYEVDYKLRAQAVEKTKQAGNKPQENLSTESSENSGSEQCSADSNPLTTEEVAEQARLQRLAAKMAEQAAEEISTFTKLPVPIATKRPSVNHSEHLDAFPAPYIIKDPCKMSYKESLYVSAIEKRFTEPRAKDLWLRFTKYFNGAEALEDIALRENMKRKETWQILMNYQEYLLVCRYW